jgi:hypothetical protein
MEARIDPAVVVEGGFVAEAHVLAAHGPRDGPGPRSREAPPVEDQVMRPEQEHVDVVVGCAQQARATQRPPGEIVGRLHDLVHRHSDVVGVGDVDVDGEQRRGAEGSAGLAALLTHPHAEHGVLRDDGEGPGQIVDEELAAQVHHAADVGHGRMRVQVVEHPEASLDGRQREGARRCRCPVRRGRSLSRKQRR